MKDDFYSDMTAAAAAIYQHYSSGIACTIEELMLGLHLTRKEVDDAISFWDAKGFVATDEEIATNTVPFGKIIVLPKEPSTQKKDEASDRLRNDPALTELAEQAETILCRMLTSCDVSAIDNLRRNGLPDEVIKYLLEYARENADGAARYYEKTGLDWIRNGINTVKAATDYVNRRFKNNQHAEAKNTQVRSGSRGGIHPSNEREQDLNALVMDELLKKIVD